MRSDTVNAPPPLGCCLPPGVAKSVRVASRPLRRTTAPPGTEASFQTTVASRSPRVRTLTTKGGSSDATFLADALAGTSLAPIPPVPLVPSVPFAPTGALAAIDPFRATSDFPAWSCFARSAGNGCVRACSCRFPPTGTTKPSQSMEPSASRPTRASSPSRSTRRTSTCRSSNENCSTSTTPEVRPSTVSLPSGAFTRRSFRVTEPASPNSTSCAAGCSTTSFRFTPSRPDSRRSGVNAVRYSRYWVRSTSSVTTSNSVRRCSAKGSSRPCTDSALPSTVALRLGVMARSRSRSMVEVNGTTNCNSVMVWMVLSGASWKITVPLTTSKSLAAKGNSGLSVSSAWSFFPSSPSPSGGMNSEKE